MNSTHLIMQLWWFCYLLNSNGHGDCNGPLSHQAGTELQIFCENIFDHPWSKWTNIEYDQFAHEIGTWTKFWSQIAHCGKFEKEILGLVRIELVPLRVGQPLEHWHQSSQVWLQLVKIQLWLKAKKKKWMRFYEIGKVSTVWKCQKFTLTIFHINLREIKELVTKINCTKNKMFSQNILGEREIFRYFSTQWNLYLSFIF